jgi:hypothetical protein
MPFVDFAALKQRISIEQVVGLLGLEMRPEGNQLRSACPACQKGDKRTLVVTPSKGVWFCHVAEKGGDLINLAAHVRDEKLSVAAHWLEKQVGGVTSTPSSPTSGGGTVSNSSTSAPVTSSTSHLTVPNAPAAEPMTATPNGVDPRLIKIADRLDHEHPDVLALGLSPETAEDLGVGYDPKGVMRGRVLFPLYRDGVLTAFMGFAPNMEPMVKFPSQLTEPAQPSAQVIKLKA